jgi:hypothetical protein
MLDLDMMLVDTIAFGLEKQIQFGIIIKYLLKTSKLDIALLQLRCGILGGA